MSTTDITTETLGAFLILKDYSAADYDVRIIGVNVDLIVVGIVRDTPSPPIPPIDEQQQPGGIDPALILIGGGAIGVAAIGGGGGYFFMRKRGIVGKTPT